MLSSPVKYTTILLIASIFALLSVSAAIGGSVVPVHDWAIEVPGGWLGYVEWGSWDPTVTITHRYFYFGPFGQVETSIGPVPTATGAAIAVCVLVTWAAITVSRRSRSKRLDSPTSS